MSIVTLFLIFMSFTEMSRESKSILSGLGNRFASTLSTATSTWGKRDNQNTQIRVSADDDATTSLSQQYYSIRILDAETQRGIPLVYLKTTFRTIHVTDSAGYIAFFEPELMTGAGLWVHLVSYGYETPKAGFGTEGVQIAPTPGGSITLWLKRTQLAQRLYRMTGYGIYRDSVLLGLPTPIKAPMLNAQVAGSDTIQCAKYQGKLLWMWQDTEQIAWPLGNFNMTGATTALPEDIDAERGVDFKYLTTGPNNDPGNFVRALAKVPLDVPGSFPIWVDGLTVVPDEKGRERLVARYYASGPSMECMEEGLVQWNDTTQALEKIAKSRQCGGLVPQGHTYYVRDNGTRYAYYGKNVRVKADYASVRDLSQYEAFTCLSPDGKKAVRGSDGALLWSWVRGGKPVNYETTNDLVAQGLFRADESAYRLVDVDTGQPFTAAQVGIAWNAHLQLWVNIVQQLLGDTTAGEIWLATAQAPEGPWTNAKKVATHYMNENSFQNNSNDLYNPVQHYELMGREGDRVVYFSGTFVNTFSGNSWSTPYYHYNNIMYRMDLNDPKLALPPPPPGLWNTTPDTW